MSFLVFIGLLFATTSAFAAKVKRATKKAAELELGPNEDFVKGDKLSVMVNGKLVGTLKVRKVSGNKKVITRILSGRAPVGASVTLKGAGSTGGEIAAEESDSNLIVGALFGYGMDNQSVKASSSSGLVTENLSMSGSGFSAKAFADMSIADELGLIARLGAETFNVTGKSKSGICAGSTSCKTEIMYLSADLLVRYNFSPGSINPYAAGGLGIYFPLTKKTNVLDETKIASTTIFFVTLGANIRLGSMFIPIQVEYGLFPPSNEVSTNFITGRAGLGWEF